MYYNGIKIEKGYYEPIAYTSDVSSTPLAILYTMGIIILGLVGSVTALVVGLFFSPVAGFAIFGCVLAGIISLSIAYIELNTIDDVYTSTYKNYCPELIDINRYNMNYNSEVIDAVSL